MGVLVLPPQDVAPHHHRRLISPPRSKQRRSTVTHAPTAPAQTRSNRRKQWSPAGSPPPPPKSKPSNDGKVQRAKSPDLSAPVRILKRGEELTPKEPTKPSATETTPVKERKMTKTKREGSVDRANSDPVVLSGHRASPEPGPVPNPFTAGFYAGSAFSTSPPPSSLPVPAFCAKIAGAACLTKSTVEDVALDLRRILRLEL